MGGVSGALPVLPPPTVHCVWGWRGSRPICRDVRLVVLLWVWCGRHARCVPPTTAGGCLCTRACVPMRRGRATRCVPHVAAADLVKGWLCTALLAVRYGTASRGVCCATPTQPRARAVYCLCGVYCPFTVHHAGWSTHRVGGPRQSNAQGAMGGEGEVGRSAGCNQCAHGTS